LKNERELAKKNFEEGLIPELTNLDLADVPRRRAKKKEETVSHEQEDTMTETVSETVSESITDTQTQTASESESETEYTEESSSVSEVPQVRSNKQALFRRRL
jgi:hypothetical protein